VPAPNLTTLANVKSWLNVTTSNDDALLTRLIQQTSRYIYGELGRASLFQHTVSETYDGPGRARLILRQWPVLSVTSLTVGTQAIQAAASYGQTGYQLQTWDGIPPGAPQALDLNGYVFCPGSSNVAVTYTAGYVVQNEAQTIPGTPYQVTVEAPYGNFAVDQGVNFTGGAALTKVASAPAAGQYSVDAAGKYTFAAADTAKPVQISYSFIPADIEQACIEIAAERYRYKDRIGQTSKSLGGQETASYLTKKMTDYVDDLIQAYRNMVPA
jgi:Phage gp6-like head-tail connector protein